MGRRDKLIKMENNKNFFSLSNSEKRTRLFVELMDELFKLHST